MSTAKCMIKGTDFIGVFATANEEFALIGRDIGGRAAHIIADTLNVKLIDCSMFGTDLVGLFAKANSNGILVSNIMEEHEIEHLRKQTALNVGFLESNLNAIGNNI